MPNMINLAYLLANNTSSEGKNPKADKQELVADILAVHDYQGSDDYSNFQDLVRILVSGQPITEQDIYEAIVMLNKSSVPIQNLGNSGLVYQQQFGNYADFSVNMMVMIMLYLIQHIIPKEIEATNKMQESVIKFLANYNEANQAMAKMTSELADSERAKAYSAAGQIYTGAICNAAMSLGGAAIEIAGHIGSFAKSQLAMENFTTRWNAAKDKIEQAQSLLKDFKEDPTFDQSLPTINANAQSINSSNKVDAARNTLVTKQSELATAEVRPNQFGGLIIKDNSSEITVAALSQLEAGQKDMIDRVSASNSNVTNIINAEKEINQSKNSVDWNLIKLSTKNPASANPAAVTILEKLKQNKSLYNVTEDANGNITQVAYIQEFTNSQNVKSYNLMVIKYDTTSGKPNDVTEYLLDIPTNSQFNAHYDLAMNNNQAHMNTSSIYAYQNKEVVAKIEELYQLDNNDLAKITCFKNSNNIDNFNRFKQLQTNYKAVWDYQDQNGNQIKGNNSVTVFSGGARAKNGYQLLRLADQDVKYAQEYDQLLYGQKLGNEGMLQPFVNRIETNRQRYESAIRLFQAVNNALLASARSLEGACNAFSQQLGADAKFQGEMLNLEQTLTNSNLQQIQQLINDLVAKISQIVSDVVQNLLQAYQTMTQSANLRNG